MSLISTIKNRGLLWVSVHVSLWVFDKFVEFVLYPSAIVTWGLVYGTAVMMFASLVICIILIALYDRVSNTIVRDALGFETIKEVIEGFQSWIYSKWPFRGKDVRPGSIVFRAMFFLYVSLWHDPMTCLILMREKNKHSMDRREWAIFFGSVFVSNASWGLMVWAGVETLEQLFPMFWEQVV